MSAKRRYPLRDSTVREIIKELSPKFGDKIKDIFGKLVEIAELENGAEVIISDGEPILVRTEEEIFPLIPAARSLPLKRVTIDMGAVGPITDGADVMAPGVVDANEEIAPGEIVGIEDERHHKLLALGIALREGSSLPGERGKAIKNLHHVGDEFWDLLKIL
ncbi:hypothetical protein AKJ45_01045 [candidate division MSBL1 archaeon SCGC-AAA261F19]|uniref:PUA domain-containing protein n=2 Tax=candidate division MSBL1 TaxID=215777 RepID=A0A133VB00_9EURY|nr:hypothetical protein AKJ43_01235 [candidate division MSBL1 archaeon SCGC-AAA261D19]KXB03623.1 hypothetical protein AKJ45_01045 [candidate division MSBL1 archaeon SCGC-AAA261F19]